MRLTRPPVRPQPTRRPGEHRPRPDAAALHRSVALHAHRTNPRAWPRLTFGTPPTPPMSAAPARSRSIVGRRLVVVIEAAVAALVLSASAAHAEATQVLALVGSVDQVLDNIRNWVMGILAGLATVFLSIGGVRYVMGGGDPGEIEKAKTAFKAAGIGYGLAALAPLVVTVLQGIVGA
jgi:hypothetical protein